MKLRMTLTAVALASLTLASGCARPHEWVLRTVPTTEEERARVAEETERILAATPTGLAGHDQDWDDAIKEAKKTAMETWCRPTLWEMAPTAPYSAEWDFTGQWKPLAKE
jgi:hypothetical protein